MQRSEIHKMMFFYPEIVRKGATDQQSPDLISVFGLANPSFSLQKQHQPIICFYLYLLFVWLILVNYVYVYGVQRSWFPN